MRVNAVVDAAGRVAEVRILYTTSARAGVVAPPEAHAAVLDAVRQWEFEAPLQAPMLITTDVVVGDAALLVAAKAVRGSLVLECTVGTDGSVTDTSIVQSIPLLDHAAVESVRQWRYTPTLLNGEPVPVIVTVTVSFTLK